MNRPDAPAPAAAGQTGSVPGEPAPGAAAARGPDARGLVWLVTQREIVTRVRERGFLVSTAVTLLIVVAIVVVPALFDGGTDSVSVGVVGSASELRPALEQASTAADATLTTREFPDEAAARAAVDDGRVDAAFVGEDRVVVAEDLDGRTEEVVQAAYRQVTVERRLAAAGIDAARLGEALAVPPLQVDALDPAGSAKESRRGAAYVGVLLLYFQLIAYGMWVAMGVAEEKSSRVVELLLATLRPWQLLAGKVLGIGLLGLGQFVLVGIVGVTSALATDAVELPSGVVGVAAQVLVWFVLGFAFYACAFAAAAALVSRQEDLSNVTSPLTILLVGSFLLAFPALNDPDGMLAKVTSLVPPFSTMVMPVRWATGDAAWWEVLLAIGLMGVAVLLLVRLAGRIYAGAVLRSGPRVKVRDALAAGRGDVG